MFDYRSRSTLFCYNSSPESLSPESSSPESSSFESSSPESSSFESSSLRVRQRWCHCILVFHLTSLLQWSSLTSHCHKHVCSYNSSTSDTWVVITSISGSHLIIFPNHLGRKVINKQQCCVDVRNANIISDSYLYIKVNTMYLPSTNDLWMS